MMSQLELIPARDGSAPLNAESQSGQILRYLQGGGTLTALEALPKFGCMRLAARIADIRAAGYRVTTTPEAVAGKTFARYRIQP